MSLQQLVDTYIKRPLSGSEINKLIGKNPVVYENLKDYKSLEALCGNHQYAIVLYQVSSKTDGHFVAMGVNFKGEPFFFDPYGFKPVQVKQRSTYDEALPDYITPMLEAYAQKSGKPVVYNTTDFQSKSGGVADCGRHSSLACLFSKQMTFDNMRELYFSNKATWLNGDHISTVLTLLALNDFGKFYKQH